MKTNTTTLCDFYEEIKYLIIERAHNFYKTFGGDYHVILSDANFAFIEAYNSYDPSHGQTLQGWCVSHILYTLHKTRIYDNRQQKYHRQIQNEMQNTFDILDTDFIHFLIDLENDAATIIDIAINTPEEIFEALADTKGSITDARVCIFNFLREKNWSHNRIRTAFRRIKNELEELNKLTRS